jgi:ribosome maturation factor RimP
MDSKEQIAAITEMIGPLLEGTDAFLVEVKIKPTHNIKVFIDADAGFAIKDSVRVNRKLYKQIEESAMYPEGEFSLEVSSPGIGEPLKLHRQYVKNIGRQVEVTFLDEAMEPIEGQLKEVHEDRFLIEEKGGRRNKPVFKDVEIFFNQIKHTTVCVVF